MRPDMRVESNEFSVGVARNEPEPTTEDLELSALNYFSMARGGRRRDRRRSSAGILLR